MTDKNFPANQSISDAKTHLQQLLDSPLPEEAQVHLQAALASLETAESELDNQAESFNLDKAKFVSNVTHELRIPMTSIMGYTDLLRKGMMGEINENQRNFLNIIRENVTSMSKLVSDLSDIYKATSGRLHLQLQPVSAASLLDKAREEVDSFLALHSQTLEVQIGADLPLIQADPERAAQMARYLIENASMYSKDGSTIRIQTEQQAGMVRFLVVDEGIGVAPDDQPLIFDQFYRSEAEEVRARKGWGLGLSVVKTLATLMGGQAGFETEPGAGSTFWFTLPAAGD